MSTSQFSLLSQRRFGPFFATQLAGAFNDNLLKQACVLLVTFNAAAYTTMAPALVTNLAAALFILPFLLFSAIAGQLADRYDKARVIQCVKAAEVAIMSVAACGFYAKSLPLLLGSIFAMGTHSAFFGPVKYSLLPRMLAKDELTGGNGLLEMGTFLSILGGTICAGVLVAATADPLVLSIALLLVSALGLATSLAIPRTGCAAPDLQVKWSVFKETAAVVKLGRREGVGVWNSLLAISWFWFFGAVLLSQFPALGKEVLHGDPSVVTLLLAVFSVGVAFGSLACEKLSAGKVEIGLVPIGSIGLSLFTLDLAFSASSLGASSVALSWAQFASAHGGWRVLLDVALIGVFGGVFIVPLYAFVQMRTAPERQSRVVAANNILNSAFMVAAAGMAGGLLAAGVSVTGLLVVCAGLNAVVALFIYRTVPEFLWRFISWVLVHTVYQVRVVGRQHIPEAGAAVLAPNHVTYADALVLCAVSPRPIRFVMDSAIFRVPVLSWLFRQVRAIPIGSGKTDPAALERAFNEISAALDAGELVCIFPEGRLTTDGGLGEFRSGITRILAKNPVPVIPVGLAGLWGSMWSRAQRLTLRRALLSRPGRRVYVAVGAPQPAGIRVEEIRAHVLALTEGKGA